LIVCGEYAPLTRTNNQKMAFAYEATDSGELSINAGELVQLLEPDDGSGWVVVAEHEPMLGSDTQVRQGLVPASYVIPLPFKPKLEEILQMEDMHEVALG
jgi:hypothetical protein